MSRFIKDISKFRKYVMYSAKSGLKSEVAGSHLGWIWWVLEPVLFMFVYWFIFSIVFGNSTLYFPIYVFIGLSMWTFFNKNLMSSVSIVNANMPIVSKVYVPKYMLIITEMLKNGFKLLISFMVIVVMMIIYKVHISIYLLWFIPILVAMSLFSFGLNCIMAHFGVFVEDLRTILNVVLRVIFYMSGVFYEIIPRDGRPSRIPEFWANFLAKCNPMAFFMTSCRNCLIYSSNINYKILGIWMVVSILLSIIGVKIIYKYENSYVKVM